MSSITARVPSGRPRVLGDLIAPAVAAPAVGQLALVAAGAGLTGLAAQVAIPLPGTPVPLTLQTFAVLVVGAALGCKRAVASMALYASLGIAGVPWFAQQGSGWALASAGYILGFILAAGLTGWLAERGADRRPLHAAAAMVLGNLVIYACGVSVLMAALEIDLITGIDRGVTPFLLSDAIKVLAAAGALPGIWALTQRRRSGRG